MLRRNFVKKTALAGIATGFKSLIQRRSTHILTLSFDDGFKNSFYQIVEIFERYNLHACLNIIASGHLSTFKKPDEYHNAQRGDFNDWNVLKKRGHEIMPHSWDHLNLTLMPLERAKEDITRCLDYFEENLDGFNASSAVYNFAYNASTADLEQFALIKVKAIRTYNILPTNPIPISSNPVRLGCLSYGPDNADKWVEKIINDFLKDSGGWLILNLHGLDEEGWGPVSSKYLDSLLKRLVKINYLDILPTGEVLPVG